MGYADPAIIPQTIFWGNPPPPKEKKTFLILSHPAPCIFLSLNPPPLPPKKREIIMFSTHQSILFLVLDILGYLYYGRVVYSCPVGS